MSDRDYHEILGIRPNAGSEEIELAYKGRRSQYHPDRYAQSDADTQSWATEKMKQVNEAYQALTNSHSRTKPNPSQSTQGSGRPTPPKERATGSTEQDAAAVLLKPEWEWFHDRVYARPNIPHKKLQGAISSYAHGVRPDDVIVLLDDTIFGGAKDGLLVTSEAIYCKEKLFASKRMAFQEIRKVEPGTKSRIMINGSEFFRADIIDHLAIVTFASRLFGVFAQTASPTSRQTDASARPSTPGADGLRALHLAAMEITRAELGGEEFPVDRLIDSQMQSVISEFPELSEAIRKGPLPPGSSADARCVELSLMLFLILHYYAFSKLPTRFKEAAGSQLTQLHAISEFYKAAFRLEFQDRFGRDLEMDDESLLLMSGMFFHRDGTGAFELNLPREEALFLLLDQLGVPRAPAKRMLRQFEDHVESWLEVLVAKFLASR